MGPDKSVSTMVKISFPIGSGDDQFFESMNAKPLGNGLFVLDNSPFYAYGVSWEDIVAATIHDGRLQFGAVVKRGGHSTYRISLPEAQGHDVFLQHWSPLELLGCTYEGSSIHRRRLYAIDVPPGVSVQKVYSVLERGEHEGWWEFEGVS